MKEKEFDCFNFVNQFFKNNRDNDEEGVNISNSLSGCLIKFFLYFCFFIGCCNNYYYCGSKELLEIEKDF